MITTQSALQHKTGEIAAIPDLFWSAGGPRPQHMASSMTLKLQKIVHRQRVASRDGSRSDLSGVIFLDWILLKQPEKRPSRRGRLQRRNY